MSESETKTTGSGEEAIIQQLNDIQDQVDSVKKEQSSSLSEEEVFEIINNSKIKYVTNGGMTIYIPSFRIRQALLLSTITAHLSSMNDFNKMGNALESVCEIMSNILKCDKDELIDNCDAIDIRKIVGIMSHITSAGNDLFKKKKLSVSFRH